MIKYAAKRLALLIPIMFCVSILAFLLVRAMPGDAATAYLTAAGIPPTDETVAAVTERLGLDRPLPVQYLDWLGRVLRFDFGNSFATSHPVGPEIFGALTNTLRLAGVAVLIVLALSLPLGFFSAMYPNGLFDNFGRLVSFLGSSMPAFWLGFLLVQFFSLDLKILPVTGMGTWKHYILPAISLSVAYIALRITAHLDSRKE